jgi:hypothetical protein
MKTLRSFLLILSMFAFGFAADEKGGDSRSSMGFMTIRTGSSGCWMRKPPGWNCRWRRSIT